ncbi:hypothetical protein NPIL_162541 [Nephila pilipes]|uniref:Uncharacterized protein n=1 Tax=Nephila pilipes TaxID=299642 RepID=A0A8X6PCY0_NEPPI|nr:hypothetical protein NPIL_162541 [Nephila pilipes]
MVCRTSPSLSLSERGGKAYLRKRERKIVCNHPPRDTQTDFAITGKESDKKGWVAAKKGKKDVLLSQSGRETESFESPREENSKRRKSAYDFAPEGRNDASVHRNGYKFQPSGRATISPVIALSHVI